MLAEKKITQVLLAKKIKVEPTELNSFLNGRRGFSDKKKIQIAEILGTDYVAMMTLGQELADKEAGRPPPREPTHDEIIRLFKDKETARKLNNMLVTLEKTDLEKYKLANAYVTALFDAAKAEQKKEGE